jgi:HAD superfamily hydrolase (TIGR01509 family)
MPGFDSVLFDFDGVLADTEPVHFACWAETLAPLGIRLEWEFFERFCVGVDDRRVIGMIAEAADPPRDPEVLWAEYPRKKELFRARMLSAPPFAPEMADFLADLHAQYKLAVVTSSARSEVESLLVAGGLRQHFDAMVCRQDVERLKPAPDPHLRAARTLGVSSPLVVEDSAPGIAAARAAGFEVLPVKNAAETPRAVTNRLAANGAPASR